ncbi:MAG: Nif3-like dinuclear metal center hexameric protein, partial [Deltaproteobacteria bacterium]|nr:Nif3-like dinuclear metal center hexameric protein [Deltaproteobacteria bacterium]
MKNKMHEKIKPKQKTTKNSQKVYIEKILNILEGHVPIATSAKWDNVGLLVGAHEWETKGAVLSIDLTPQALKIAKREDINLIITHHPCFFPKAHSISKLVKEKNFSPSTLALEAYENKIAVIACHTNFDCSALEVAEAFSQALGLNAQGKLIPEDAELLKLVVFVPSTHLETVRHAICEAGAGHIGHYDFCTFSAAGEGTFRGSAASKPFLGKAEKLEKTQELRLETIIPNTLKVRVLKALFESHPYEEVAYDLYSVVQTPTALGLTKGLGYGVWGDFSQLKVFSDLLQDVKKLFQRSWLKVTLSQSIENFAKVKRVAFLPGSGGEFIHPALNLKCEVFITGEVSYHEALFASNHGLTIMELGHTESEMFFFPTLRQWFIKENRNGFILIENIEQKSTWLQTSDFKGGQ